MNKPNRFAIALIVCVASMASLACGQEEASDIKNIATNDLIGVAYADLTKVQCSDLMNQAIEFKLIEGVKAEQASMGASTAQSFVEQLKDAGAKRIYCLFRQADIENMAMPLLVVSTNEKASIKKLQRRAKMLAGMTGVEGIQASIKGNLVVVGLQDAVESYLKSSGVLRENLEKAWKQTDSSNAGVIVCGDSDSRRVIRELFPRMAKPYEGIDGTLLADRIDYFAVSMKLEGKFTAKIVVQASDSEAAKIVADAYGSFAAFLKKTEGENEKLELSDQGMTFALKVATPIVCGIDAKVNDSTVELNLDQVLADPKLLVDAIEPIKKAARVSQTKNDMRQILLAMLNYESAYKVLPVGPITDDNGKPLLSWRVRILPFLDQNNLYKQFKLDEPWDSPHNIKLLQVFPVNYASPFVGDEELMASGKTRFVCPVGAGCASSAEDGLAFRQMKDGSSNTIAVLLSSPEAAVEWTKPSDWEINMAAPTKTILKGDSPKIFGVFDGSVHEFRPDATDEVLKAMLTFEGGEAFNWSAAAKK